jgi:hypothetical protein
MNESNNKDSSDDGTPVGAVGNRSVPIVEVADVRVHRRATSEEDDCLLISGKVRLNQDNTQFYRFRWNNVARCLHERLHLIESEVPDLWLQSVPELGSIIDDYCDADHPILTGWIPRTKTEYVLLALTHDFRDDLERVSLDDWSLSTCLYDEVSFEGLIL